MSTNENQKNSLSFMDIDRMADLFNERPDILEFVTKTILQKDTLKVKTFEICKMQSSLEGKSLSIAFDAFDESFDRYTIKICKSDEEITPIKAKFYLSQLLPKNFDDDPQNLDTLQIRLIFITDDDVYKAGEPLYHILWRGTNFNLPFDYEDEQIIYVNGAYKGDDDIGKLIHDLNCTNADDMYYTILAERARELSK